MSRTKTLPVAALALLLAAPAAAVTEETIAIDGTNDFDAGAEASGTSGSTWYFAYDDTYVYVGLDAPDVAANSSTKFAFLYIDTDPSGTNGSSTGVVYNTQEPGLGMDADFHLRWRTDNTYLNMLDWNNGTASWADDNTGADNFGLTAFQSGTYLEIAIPRASLGSPDVIEVAGGMLNEQGGAEYTFFVVPTSNSEGYDADLLGAPLQIDMTPPAATVPLPLWALMGIGGGLGALGASAARRREDEA